MWHCREDPPIDLKTCGSRLSMSVSQASVSVWLLSARAGPADRPPSAAAPAPDDNFRNVRRSAFMPMAITPPRSPRHPVYTVPMLSIDGEFLEHLDPC